MATVSVATSADAVANGWNFCGSGTNWFAEKRCQTQGKFCCAATTSAALVTAIQQIENHHGRLGPNSPEFSQNSTWKGHI